MLSSKGLFIAFLSIFIAFSIYSCNSSDGDTKVKSSDDELTETIKELEQSPENAGDSIDESQKQAPDALNDSKKEMEDIAMDPSGTVLTSANNMMDELDSDMKKNMK